MKLDEYVRFTSFVLQGPMGRYTVGTGMEL